MKGTDVFNKINQIKEIKIYNSDANFFFFQTFDHFNKIKEQLFKEKILVKEYGNMEIIKEQCVQQ